MIDRIAAIIVDESKWLPISMTLAFLSLAILLYRRRKSDLPARRKIVAGMNLFFAVTIGTMALGHFLAVSTKLALGSLENSPLRLYLIGIAFAFPSWWLIIHAASLFHSDQPPRRTIMLNAWLAVTLLALGITNLPLAAPAFFNIAYLLHTRRVTGLAILSFAVVFNVALFLGALLFLASGQSFEQFTGME
jgi:hypothetical protein